MKGLAKTSGSFRKHAKSKHSRICFQGDLRVCQFEYDQQMNTLKTSTYPNYAINQESKIDTTSAKPNKIFDQNSKYSIEFQHMVKIHDVFKTMKDQEILENCLTGFGQLIVVFLPKSNENTQELSCGTFVTVRINGKMYFFTALHIFSTFDEMDYVKIPILNFSSLDLYKNCCYLLGKNNYDFSNIDTFIEDVTSLENIPKVLLILAQLNQNFLNFRVTAKYKKYTFLD